MSKYIATKLHQAIELAPEEEFFRRCATLPHYVVDPSLIDLLARSDVQNSIAAMIDANIARLPFPALVLEAEFGKLSRSIVLLEEQDGKFRGQIAVIRPEVVELDPGLIVVSIDAEGWLAEAVDCRTHPAWSTVVGLSVAIALLMLNIQGVEKEVIEPSRLNRQRVASSKPSIPSHTVMRIGHVYDSDGKRHNLSGSGRTMPVHMRAGHARRQHYGEGNELTKIVYIPPVLVNFRTGAEPRVPKKVLAA